MNRRTVMKAIPTRSTASAEPTRLRVSMDAAMGIDPWVDAARLSLGKVHARCFFLSRIPISCALKTLMTLPQVEGLGGHSDVEATVGVAVQARRAGVVEETVTRLDEEAGQCGADHDARARGAHGGHRRELPIRSREAGRVVAGLHLHV